jgi:acyl-CoA thioesterase FadM
MNLFVRMLYLILTAWRRPAVTPLGVSRLPMRVWPGDLDLLLHMNNGRYLTIMDLGRVDLMMRSGLLWKLRSRGWYPVVAALVISYRRPLKFWQRFEMTTQVVGWDERWIYMRQEFHAGGKLSASAVIKGTFRGPEGAVPMSNILELAGVTGASPKLPSAAAALADHDASESQAWAGKIHA